MSEKKKYDLAIMNLNIKNEAKRCLLMKKASKSSEDVFALDKAWFLNADVYYPRLYKRKMFEGIIENVRDISIEIMQELFNYDGIERVLKISDNAKNPIDVIKFGFENEIEESVIKKLNFVDDPNISNIRANSKKVIDYNFDNITDNDLLINVWHRAENCYDCVFGDIKGVKTNYITFNSVNEKENFINSLRTTFMDFIFVKFSLPCACRTQTIIMFKDYSRHWDDKRFCEYFGINGFIDTKRGEPGSEWEYIVETVNKHCRYERQEEI